MYNIVCQIGDTMYTKEELEKAVKISKSYSETLRNLNRSITGSAHGLVKKNIKKHNIDIRHFLFKNIDGNSSHKIPAEEILVYDNNRTYRRCAGQLRRALIEIGVEYKCSRCSTVKWQDEDITLEIDHIDGDWKNNTPTNLRFLCPNCHSLTPNFYHTKLQSFCDCGSHKRKNSPRCKKCSKKLNQRIDGKPRTARPKKVEWPTQEYLQRLLLEKPLTKIAEQFGVSDSAVIKWCKHYNLQRPGRGYWSKK